MLRYNRHNYSLHLPPLCKWVLLIVLFWPIDYVWSQGNTVISYDQEDGLCGQNQISCFVDRSGRVWSVSYRGGIVSYFDGVRWKCLDSRNGILPFGVQKIFQDKEDNIWLINYERGMTMISKQEIITFKFGTETLPGSYDYYLYQGIPYLLNRENFKVYIFNHDRKNFIYNKKISEQNRVLTGKSLFMKSFDSYDNIFLYSSANYIHGSLLFKCYKYKNGELAEINLNTYPYRTHCNNNFKYTGNLFSIGNREVTLIKSDKTQLILKATFRNIVKNEIQLEIKGISIYNFNTTNNELIIIYELAEGHRYLLAEYAMDSGKLISSLIYYSDYNPHDVCKDKANTYWVTTEANIQRILPYQFHLSPTDDNFPSQTWSIIQAHNGDMWMSSYGSGLARFDGNRIYPQPKSFPSNARFDDVSIYDNGQMIFNREAIQANRIDDSLTSGLFVFDGVNPPKLKLNGNLGFFFGRNNKSELLWGSYRKGLWILPKNKEIDDEKNWIKIDSSKGLLLDNVLTALQDNYGRYWMGKPSLGIAIYDPIADRCKNFLKTIDSGLFGAMSMDKDKWGNIWLGTDEGLYFVKNAEDLFEKGNIKEIAIKISPDIIGSSQVNICKVYDDNILVIGNLSGYYLLDLDFYYKHGGQTKFQSINKIDYRNYLGGQTNQNGIAFDRDRNIWITTSKGVYRHSPAMYVQDTLPTSLILDSMVIGNRIIKFNVELKHIDLEHTERSFTIYFHHQFSPFLYDNVRYRYRIDSTHSWSILTSVDSINYQNLSPGSYNLQIQAIKNGLESPIQNISFTIDRVLWLKWWFWLGIGSVVSMVLLFLYNKQRSIQAQKLALSQKETEVELMSKEKDRLQVQAIVNQLNPHFINNALQWLQVRVDDDLEAVKVIGKLSENISTVFRNSRKQINYHSLKEEIQLTNNYLFIQKCRFGDKLNIEVPGIDTLAALETYNVPIMMVQIHAENAIEHGIRNNDNGGGTVKIEVTDKGDSFIISVSDDGVGRDKSKLIGSKGTQNGTKMLSEIEKIFNKQNKLKISQQYIDGIYRDSEGLYYGTKVIITIPKQYNYII